VCFRGECSLVKAAWFKHYTLGGLPETFDRTVQSWGTANKATELSRHPAERRVRSAHSGCSIKCRKVPIVWLLVAAGILSPPAPRP
jgi:hypothetical protein